MTKHTRGIPGAAGAVQDRSEERPVILIADDDPDDRMFASEAFEEVRVPADIRFVEDGAQLVDWVTRRGKFVDAEHYPSPDLVVLDLRMPKKSGHEALEELRSVRSLSRLPIVVLSTSQAEEDVLLSYRLGANAHVFKPATFSGLAELLGRVCRFWLGI